MQTVLAIDVADCRTQIPRVRDVERKIVVDTTNLTNHRVIPAIHTVSVPFSLIDKLQTDDTVH